MIRASQGLVDFMMQYGSFKRAFYGGNMKIRSGGQPATANAATTGTLGLTVTTASGTLTHETRPAASVTLTGGSSGTVSSITIGGYEVLGATVTYDTSLAVTAALIAAQINKFCSAGFAECYAESSGAVVTIYAVQGSGNIAGAIVVTAATITHTEIAMGTAVAGVTAVNGFDFGVVADGVLQKSGVWSGAASATITAGWFRIEGSIADDDSLSTTLIRLDGTCGTPGSGADLSMATTSLVSGNTYSIDVAGITLPKFAS